MRNEFIKQAQQIIGGTSAMALAIGVKPPTVSQWIAGKRRVPAERCMAIEQATNGEVTRYDLRPDVFGPASASSCDSTQHREAA